MEYRLFGAQGWPGKEGFCPFDEDQVVGKSCQAGQESKAD